MASRFVICVQIRRKCDRLIFQVRSRVRVQSQERWGENAIPPHAPLHLQLNAISAQVFPVIPNELDNFFRL